MYTRSPASYAIPAVPATPSSPMRLLIIPNANVFFGSDGQPVWTAERITEMMSWSDASNASEYWDRVVACTPDMPAAAYADPSFYAAWNTWAESSFPGLATRFTITYNFAAYPEIYFSCGNGATDRIRVSFFGKEFWSRYAPSCSATWEDADNGKVGTEQDGWLEVIGSVFTCANFDRWYGNPGLTDKSIMQRFADGDTSVTTWLEDDGEDAIKEVYILELVDGKLQARAFYVPHAYDPAGHLP